MSYYSSRAILPRMDRRIDSGQAHAAGKAGVEWKVAQEALTARIRLNALRRDDGKTLKDERERRWALALGETVVDMSLQAQKNADHQVVFHGALEQLHADFVEAAHSPILNGPLTEGIMGAVVRSVTPDAPSFSSMIPSKADARRVLAFNVIATLGFTPRRNPIGEQPSLQVSRDMAA